MKIRAILVRSYLTNLKLSFLQKWNFQYRASLDIKVRKVVSLKFQIRGWLFRSQSDKLSLNGSLTCLQSAPVAHHCYVLVQLNWNSQFPLSWISALLIMSQKHLFCNSSFLQLFQPYKRRNIPRGNFLDISQMMCRLFSQRHHFLVFYQTRGSK